MLNLDQVRLLENRVEKAVGKIQTLTAENTHLRSQLSGLQARVNELEGLVRAFKDDQGRIEEGILSALDRLSAFEDTVFKQDSKPAFRETEATSSAQTIQQTTVETVSSEKEPLTAETNPSIPEELSDTLDITAEWEEEDKKPAALNSSSDGQMDIF